MTPHEAYNRCTDRMVDALLYPDEDANPRTIRALVGLGCLADESDRTPTRIGRRVVKLYLSGEPRDPRRECSVCGARRRVRNDGKIGAHQGQRGKWCSGGARPATPRGPKRRGPTTAVHARVPLSIRERVSELGADAGVAPRDVVAEAIVRWFVRRGHDEAEARLVWGVAERIDLSEPVEAGEAMTRATWSLPAAAVAVLDEERGEVTRAEVIREALTEALA